MKVYSIKRTIVALRQIPVRLSSLEQHKYHPESRELTSGRKV